MRHARGFRPRLLLIIDLARYHRGFIPRLHITRLRNGLLEINMISLRAMTARSRCGNCANIDQRSGRMTGTIVQQPLSGNGMVAPLTRTRELGVPGASPHIAYNDALSLISFSPSLNLPNPAHDFHCLHPSCNICDSQRHDSGGGCTLVQHPVLGVLLNSGIHFCISFMLSLGGMCIRSVQGRPPEKAGSTLDAPKTTGMGTISMIRRLVTRIELGSPLVSGYVLRLHHYHLATTITIYAYTAYGLSDQL